MLLHYAKDAGQDRHRLHRLRGPGQGGERGVHPGGRRARSCKSWREHGGRPGPRCSPPRGCPRRAPSRKGGGRRLTGGCASGSSPGRCSPAAYERCVDNTGKFNVSYINKILEGWHKHGRRATSRSWNALEAKRKDDREQATSYDIDQLEKISFFDLPEGAVSHGIRQQNLSSRLPGAGAAQAPGGGAGRPGPGALLSTSAPGPGRFGRRWPSNAAGAARAVLSGGDVRAEITRTEGPGPGAEGGVQPAAGGASPHRGGR